MSTNMPYSRDYRMYGIASSLCFDIALQAVHKTTQLLTVFPSNLFKFLCLKFEER